MLRIYCLPGRAFAELAYLFPASGTVWASARRRESKIAHFIFSTLFYGGAIMLLLSIVNPRPRPISEDVTSASSANPVRQDIQPRVKQTIIDEGKVASPIELDEVISQERRPAVQRDGVDEAIVVNSDLRAERANEASVPVAEEVSPGFTPEEEAFINNPRRSEAVKAPIQAAHSTGARQKWEDGRFSGSAVPSTTNTGCTLVSYTIDQVARDRQPSSPAAFCD